jgi:hypothetical protein
VHADRIAVLQVLVLLRIDAHRLPVVRFHL